ncbi:hypothetical protein DMC18_07240 [Caulobacter sp. D5]|nr:hypothetical protein DMC18_07240 [Caulobacter sp. D5]
MLRPAGGPLSRSATAPPEGEYLKRQDPPPLGEVARRAGGGFSAQTCATARRTASARSSRSAMSRSAAKGRPSILPAR